MSVEELINKLEEVRGFYRDYNNWQGGGVEGFDIYRDSIISDTSYVSNYMESGGKKARSLESDPLWIKYIKENK